MLSLVSYLGLFVALYVQITRNASALCVGWDTCRLRRLVGRKAREEASQLALVDQ